MADKLQEILDEVETKAKDKNRFEGAQPEASLKEVKPAAFEKNPKKNKNIPRAILNAIIPMKGDKVFEIVRKSVFLVSVTVGIICLSIIMKDMNANRVNQAIQQELAEIVEDFDRTGVISLSDEKIEKIREEAPGIMDKYIALYERNNDVVGWLTIPDTVCNYPVMQYRRQLEDGTWTGDNEYYLYKTIDHDYLFHGTIYADWRYAVSAESRPNNTVLYGHNMRDGTMFAPVSKYWPYNYSYTGNIAFYKTRPVVTFDTIYEPGLYKVFAVMYVHTEEEKYDDVYDYFRKREFEDKESFYDFIINIMDRSGFYTDVDLEYGDEILTLSTCYYWPLSEAVDARVAVFARRVREGESPEVDVDKAWLNPSPKYFKKYYQTVGGEWGGRNWDTGKVLGLDEFLAENEHIYG